MGFDVARAAQEAFQSRLPFLDRLLSYLYFADLAVLEESTWDDFGHGVTVLGRRGPDRPAGGVMLAAPLPRASILAGLDPRSPDLDRAGTLLAMAWAIASLEESDLVAPVTLVAARPDPLGTGLRSVLDSRFATGRHVIAAAPTGPAPAAPRCAVAILSIQARIPVRPLRAPLRDVVTLATVAAPGRELGAALAGLEAATRDGSLEPLDLIPAPGVHLAAPEPLRLTVGFRTSDPRAPAGWRIESRPGTVLSTGSSVDRFLALAATVGIAVAAIREAWDRAGLPAPRDAFRVVDVGSVDPATTLVAIGLPTDAATPEALDRLASRMSAADGVRSTILQSFVPARSDGPAFEGPAILDTATCLVGHVSSRVTALGPASGDLSGDPPARIRDWGVRYRDALHAALASPSDRRSP